MMAIFAEKPNMTTNLRCKNPILRQKAGHPLQPTAVAQSSSSAKDVATLLQHCLACHMCHYAPGVSFVQWPFRLKSQI